ncbi:MAG TPA: hypothetical protein VF229_00110 [Burkholderiaceae bacterium]
MTALRIAFVAFVAGVAAALGGCATNYDLTLMPRDSGKLYYGSASDIGNWQARVSVTIGDTAYSGTWVMAAPEVATGYVTAAGGWRRMPYSSVVTVDTPAGGTAKALLQAPDGAGLRCDFYGVAGGRGGGTCTDDKGVVYDVQLRPRDSR